MFYHFQHMNLVHILLDLPLSILGFDDIINDAGFI